ncbi:MAG TPA: hypothetical protein VGW38_08245 [Chloroflexota bacterium]|nr:hypothetical protein [Chloroflexota bacterium]
MKAGEAEATRARCGGDRLDVRVAGGAGEPTAAAFQRHDRRKGLEGVVGVSGVACTSCGHVELYATEPERLRDS